jgi:protein ImuB
VFAALVAPSIPAAAIIDVARAFTPRFEPVGPLVLLDAGGLSRLFGSAHELGACLTEALAKHAPGGATTPRVAIAPTQTAAALLALGRPGLTVVEPGQEARALAPLSISVLERYEHLRTCAPQHPSTPAPQHPETSGWHHPRHTHQASRPKPKAGENRHLEILTKWGIRTLGAFAALAGPEVFERLGDHGLQWQAVARGVDARPLVPWVDEIPFEAALELEWPIEGLEPLSFVLARLFEPLSERLERADRGAAVIHTSLRLTTKRVHVRTLPLPSPMRDAKTLRTLVLLDLETHPPDAQIDIVRVFIEPTPGRVLQWTLLERAQPAPEQVSTLVARLSALMGESHVGSPVPVDSWKPGAFEMTPFQVLECSGAEVLKCSGAEVLGRSGAEVRAGDGEDGAIGAALRRFRFPIPARVQVQEGRPVRIVTDRNGFTSGAVVQAAGPWRTSGEWWNTPGPSDRDDSRADSASSASSAALSLSADASAGWDRDEWDVAMADGTIYRLVVERGVGQWFLEGVID